VHAVFVLDDDGRPGGVVSDTDLIAGESPGGADTGPAGMRDVTARQLMTAPVLTIDAGADVSEAAARLVETHVGRLLVVEDGRPVGVLSVSDVVAFIGDRPRPRETLAQVMSHAIVVSQPDASIAAAARAMTERRSRSIAVVDVVGRPVGVVTGHDLLRVLGDERASKVADVMSREILSIEPGATLRQAAALMLRHRVHRLVVVDPTPVISAPVGVISTADIVAAMASVAPDPD
jgi:CBS domain-containing protein